MSVFLETLVRAQPKSEPATSLALGLLTFIAVGGSAAFGYLILVNLVVWMNTGVADWLVSALCYAAMIGPAYLLHRRFSFRSDAPHGKALPRYIAVQMCAVAFAALFSFVAYGVIGMPSVFASVLVVALTAAVNFVVLRAWAFASA